MCGAQVGNCGTQVSLFEVQVDLCVTPLASVRLESASVSQVLAFVRNNVLCEAPVGLSKAGVGLSEAQIHLTGPSDSLGGALVCL